MIFRTDRPILTGPVARIIVTLLCGALWMGLSWMIYRVLPDTDVVFLRAGITSFLAALPLLAVCRFYPVRPGLWRWRRGLQSGAVTLVFMFPFIIAGLVQAMSWTSPGAGWITTAFLILLLAAAEEMIFRGFLVNILSFGGRLLWGIALSSLLFALVHADNACATVTGVINIAIFGVLLSLLRLMSGGIMIPSIVHWVWNLTTGMVFGWRVSGYELPTLWSPGTVQLWGSFGPEGSLLLTFSLAVAIAVALRLRGMHSLR